MPRQAIRPTEDIEALADAELAALSARGHAGAFRLIMERNNARLYRVARGILQSDSEAEDAVQESYVRAFQKLGTFRGTASLSTWLTRIVINEALGRLRAARPTAELAAVENTASASVVVLPNAAGVADPEQLASRREIARLLERAIDALPEAFRVVFIMRAVEEMSVQETAESLAVPEATVKTRLHRARALLRRDVEAEVGSALSDAFPFAGRRCARSTAAVLKRLGLEPPDSGD